MNVLLHFSPEQSAAILDAAQLYGTDPITVIKRALERGWRDVMPEPYLPPPPRPAPPPASLPPQHPFEVPTTLRGKRVIERGRSRLRVVR